jgi:hypothetical protein
MRRAELGCAALLLAVLAGCGVSGTPVPECGGSGSEDRAVAIVRPPAATDEERPLAIECWRKLRRERIELWFSYPPGPECWQLSSIQLRESAETISVTIRAAPAPVCASDAGAEALTQIDLQAPVEHREVLDGSGA